MSGAKAVGEKQRRFFETRRLLDQDVESDWILRGYPNFLVWVGGSEKIFII